MLLKDKRVRIITGHYGSGKTEISINYAVKLSELGKKVAIADLDIVNPYFRSRECESLFKEKNIELLGFTLKEQGMDLPALSANVMKPFLDDSYEYVIDLGGSSAGAKAFSSFRKSIDPDICDVFLVLNANRPETMTLEDSLAELNRIEGVINMKVTGIINNTHLIWETSVEDIKKGDLLAKELSEKTGIPIVYTACKKEMEHLITSDIGGELFTIDILNRKTWM